MANVVTIKDSDGKVIKFAPLDFFGWTEFLLALGAEASKNEEYKQWAMLAYQLEEHDGMPLPKPTNLTEIKQHIKRLGTPGINAMMQYGVDEVARREAESKSDESDNVLIKN